MTRPELIKPMGITGHLSQSELAALIERFWVKVDKNGPIIHEELGPCWEFTKSKKSKGYGQIYVRRVHSPVTASRLAWEIQYGPIPDGLGVLHRCDNPPCVRGEHLFLGTVRDNAIDMVAKGRAFLQHHSFPGDPHWSHVQPELITRGEAHGMAKLKEWQVLQIRALVPSGVTCASLAQSFGVHPGTVELIAKGKTWRHLLPSDGEH